ncbi:unnamed protein product [Lactuca virosa]|uniref:Uncharacterized protein n=1 Tax=Lactuca virosa TaxID=75947 RepID=A0AAU9MKV8_9ASTR|nr:unnamed protein product [Lactuca virosa]
MISATNKLIKQTHVRHEKKIQRLEKEIWKKDKMNLIMQQVLIKLLRACLNIVDVPNNKFEECSRFLGSLFDHLKAQAPTVESYESLSKHINMSFQQVFERLTELQTNARLASDVGPSDAIGGE